MKRNTLPILLLLMLATGLGERNSSAQDTALGTQQPTQAAPVKTDERTTRLTVQVFDDSSKKPIYNAHVVVRFEVGRLLRRDKRVSWESKANQKGIVLLTGIPRGNVKVQVIARGYQTYGGQHEITAAEEEITINMKTPSGQKSAY